MREATMSKPTTKTNKHHSKDDAARIRKRFLYEFDSAFWDNPGFQNGQDVHHLHHHVEEVSRKNNVRSSTAHSADAQVATANSTGAVVSEHTSCNTCNIKFASHYDLREHFQDDIHRLNLKRKLRNKPPVDEATFERDFDNLSDGSLSGSGEDDSDDEHEYNTNNNNANNSKAANARGKANVRVQFKDPTIQGDGEGYIVVYKAALPDMQSLASFSARGSWCVIMAGGGHFSAAIWDKDGNKIQNKSFHRYTTRRKQGGAQSIADGGKTIKSAGSTLRRYGEQALQEEVRQLLMSWSHDLGNVQCVFLRVNKRDRIKLLFGWEDSPLLELRDNDMCRSIPFSTRRATLKEVTRVYEQLSTVVLSPVSLITTPVESEKIAAPAPLKTKPPSSASSSKAKSKAPVEKGTAHLKKREPKDQNPKEDEDTEKEEVVLNEDLVKLIASISEDDLDNVRKQMSDNPALKSEEFDVVYLKGVEKLQKVGHSCGAVAVAAASASFNVLEWLLLNEAPLLVGTSPYLVTKAKRVRTFLRRFWAQHPTLHDYAAADIPGPLSEAEVAAAAEKEREKKKKEREKKKEKEFLKKEAAKPPEVRAREMRAAAAEARFLGNRCAVCKKSLAAITPFERLAYKYCSMDCCQKHRKILNG